MIRRHLINLAIGFVQYVIDLGIRTVEKLKAMRPALPRKRRPF